jgi:hypothetical protein
VYQQYLKDIGKQVDEGAEQMLMVVPVSDAKGEGGVEDTGGGVV